MGKKVDKTKVEAKKVRQAAKQDKAATRRNKKETKDLGEEDIESIIESVRAKDLQRTAVTVTLSNQPSPRSNFSITTLPNGDLLLFGGEYCNGEGTFVYNELFRWNLEKNEWRKIESLNTPPPRCSHQSVFYKDRVYIFGGEYATLDQFHHYKDMWSLDLKTNAWTEMKVSGDVPSARSGHRMAIWRNYILLFGGFYEALREVKWFNDMYIYSFQDERWTQIQFKMHAQLPKPRSGFQMIVHSLEDTVYIYGGYSKEKVTSTGSGTGGGKKEGKVHDDMWTLSLRGVLPGNSGSGGGTGKGGTKLDTSKAVWARISKKGHFPSPRCGAALVVYKNKGIVFGGVVDEEGPRHSLISTFYNDMFAFDMERKRWYQLGLKVPSKPGDKKKAKRVRSSKALAGDAGEVGEADVSDGDSDGHSDDNDDDEEDDEEEGGEQTANDPYANGNFFGYIDDSGEIVYVNMEEQMDVDSAVVDALYGPAVEATAIQGDTAVGGDHVVSGGAEIGSNDDVIEPNQIHLRIPVTQVDDFSPHTMEIDDDMALPDTDVEDSSLISPHLAIPPNTNTTSTSTSTARIVGEGRKEVIVEEKAQDDDSGIKLGFVAKYFLNRVDPSPRINPCLAIRGHTLYVYGGVMELGDVEVTLDDCWSLDLNKRDFWKQVLPGTMHLTDWKGEIGDDSTVEGEDSENDDDDSDEDSDDDGDEDDGDDDDDRRGGDRKGKISKDGNKVGKSDGHSSGLSKKGKDKGTGRGGGGNMGGIRYEMESLRSKLESMCEDPAFLPVARESLRDYYSRTSVLWSGRIIQRWQRAQADPSQEPDTLFQSSEPLSEKEIKRAGFLMAEQLYQLLLPVLTQIVELEEQLGDEEIVETSGKQKTKKHR